MQTSILRPPQAELSRREKPANRWVEQWLGQSSALSLLGPPKQGQRRQASLPEAAPLLAERDRVAVVSSRRIGVRTGLRHRA